MIGGDIYYSAWDGGPKMGCKRWSEEWEENHEVMSERSSNNKR